MALEKLQAAGLRGLMGARGELRHRGRNAPELLNLGIQVRGNLHPACFTENWQAPCERCGSQRNGYPNEAAVLNAMTLPGDVDLFRLREFKTVILANERFVDTVRRLHLGDIAFRELPVR